jgi:hypothetical protein
MKGQHLAALALGLAVGFTGARARADAVDELLKEYTSEGASNFSATAGQEFWDHPVVNKEVHETRRCSLCHTNDLKAEGKHAVTGKKIEPMAPSVNPKRLSDTARMEKWFKRNCKWVLDRECTPQEKGNVLVMLRTK